MSDITINITGHIEVSVTHQLLCGSGGAASAESTVLFDVSGFSIPSSGAVTVINNAVWNTQPNVGSGGNGTTNLCLIGMLLFSGNADSASPTMTWDTSGGGATNQAMTLIPGAASISKASGGGNIYFFYLMNPTLGAKDVSASWTGANQALIAMASFVNVDQTGGATTFPSPVVAQSLSAGIPTASITASPTTRKIVGGFSSTNNFTTTTNTAFASSPNNSGSFWAVAASWDAGTAANENYSPSGSNWGAVAIQIKGAAGAASLGLQTNLSAFYQFENTSWTDQLGVNNLTGTNSPTSVPGLVGNAVKFDQAASMVLSHADAAALNFGAGNFSFQVWVNLAGGAPLSAGAGDIMSKDDGGFGNREYGLGTNFTSSNVWSWFFYTTGPAIRAVNSATAISSGFHHIVGTWDGTTQKIYIDGSIAGTATPAGTPQSSTTSTFMIGKAGDGGSFASASQNVFVDQVGIWKGRALSAGDVTLLYNSGAGLSYAAMA